MSNDKQQPYEYSLDDFAGGALLEQFNMAMREVMANIANPNTSYKVKRGLNMSLTFGTDEARELVAVETSVTPKLAPAKGFPTTIIIDRDRDGKLVSGEYGRDRNQVHMEVAPNGDVSLEPVDAAARPKLTVVNQ